MASRPKRNSDRRDRYHTDPAYRVEVIRKATQWARDHRQAYLLRSAKCRAKRQGLPFDLTIDDIVVPDVCPVLGIPMYFGTGAPHHGSPSIDRLIPSLGYIRGNVAVISWRANNLKRDALPQELLMVAAWMSAQRIRRAA